MFTISDFSPDRPFLTAPTRPRRLVRLGLYIVLGASVADIHACSSLYTRFSWRSARYVTTAASEVSSILESRISGTSIGGNVEETGRVLSAFLS